jgi:NAD(P)-dependent dehydrogenase (short-subunit alcohol dehydrogenase family)
VNSAMVLGGYGGFGARLCIRLAASGWQVLVAGRRLDAAQAFCAGVPGTHAVLADRDGDIGAVLAQQRPDILIDAAGPFQGSSYAVAEACIANGVHYIDLADGRDFVTGIDALDAAAKAKGLAVVSGASSVPALSGAVIRHLMQGMDQLCSVEMSISASSRASAGASVSASILSYVGKPVPLWQGQQWRVQLGWHMLRRHNYVVGGLAPLSRLTALADVPDHSIVPQAFSGKPATTFRAGPEFAFQTLGLWLLSWPVRWGLMRSLIPITPVLRWLQALTALFGSDRSAMMVEVKGFAGDEASLRRWTLIAERGDGLEIPTMAAALLCGMLKDGSLTPGARNALELAQFEPVFAPLAIRHRTVRQDYLLLYQRVLCTRWGELSPAVRAMHEVVGDGAALGTAQVRRGKSLLAKLLCAIMGMPPNGDHALHVAFAERDGVERWTRDFSGYRFSSELSQDGTRMIERFGPLRFHFDLPVTQGSLSMVLHCWSFAHLPMPLVLAPRITAREHQDANGKFHFDVSVSHAAIGQIVHYSGSLTQASGDMRML